MPLVFPAVFCFSNLIIGEQCDIVLLVCESNPLGVKFTTELNMSYTGNLSQAACFLKQKRRMLGKTQAEIAKRGGMQIQYASKLENDLIQISPKNLGSIVLAYELSDFEKSDLLRLIGLGSKASTPGTATSVPATPAFSIESEYRLFYQLMQLPKEAAERIVKAWNTYTAANGQASQT